VQPPHAGWLVLLLEELRYQLLDMSPAEVGDVLWALSRWSPVRTPDASFVSAAVAQVDAGMTAYSSRAWVRALQGLAGLRARPKPEWLRAAVEHTASLSPQCSGQQLMQCLLALEVLGAGPAQQLMAQLLLVQPGHGVRPPQAVTSSAATPGQRQVLAGRQQASSSPNATAGATTTTANGNEEAVCGVDGAGNGGPEQQQQQHPGAAGPGRPEGAGVGLLRKPQRPGAARPPLSSANTAPTPLAGSQ
jgi:hypothetical protein